MAKNLTSAVVTGSTYSLNQEYDNQGWIDIDIPINITHYYTQAVWPNPGSYELLETPVNFFNITRMKVNSNNQAWFEGEFTRSFPSLESIIDMCHYTFNPQTYLRHTIGFRLSVGVKGENLYNPDISTDKYLMCWSYNFEMEFQWNELQPGHGYWVLHSIGCATAAWCSPYHSESRVITGGARIGNSIVKNADGTIDLEESFKDPSLGVNDRALFLKETSSEHTGTYFRQDGSCHVYPYPQSDTVGQLQYYRTPERLFSVGLPLNINGLAVCLMTHKGFIGKVPLSIGGGYSTQFNFDTPFCFTPS